jgi:hypothetical protein
MKKAPRKWRWVILAALLVSLLGSLVLGILSWVLPPQGDPPPRGALLTEPPKPEHSSLVAPLVIPWSEMERRFNERFPTTLIEESGKEVRRGFLLDIVAARKGKSELETEGNKLVMLVPVTVEAQLYRTNRLKRFARRGKSAPDGARVTAELMLKITSSISISKNWELQTKSTISHSWRSKPTIQLGLGTFEVDKMVDKRLVAKWPEIAKKFDEQVAEKGLLRPKVEKIWTQLNEPRQMSENPSIWLLGDIDVLYAGNPTLTKRGIELKVGLAGCFRVFLGPEATPQKRPPLLPRSKPPAEQGFHLALSAELQWHAMSQIATSLLAFQEFSIPGRRGTFTIDQVSLYPSGKQIVVGIAYKANLRLWNTAGNVYLVGVPEIDDKERVLRIKDFHYVLRTWDNVIASANGIAENQLKERVQDKLVFPFGDQLDVALKQINQGLTKVVQENAIIKGELSTFTLSGVRLTDTGVLIDADGFGELSLKADLPEGGPALKLKP